MKKLILFLFVGIFMISFTSAVDLFETYNDTSFSGLDVWGVNWEGQTFTIGTVGPNTDLTLINISVVGFRNGAPTNVTFYIRATNATGHPTGANLSQGSFDPSTITTATSGQQINISMSEAELDMSTKYALIASNPTGDGTNSFRWNTNSSGGYAGGGRISSADSGILWGAETALDSMFWIWGNPGSDNVTSVLDTPLDGSSLSGNVTFVGNQSSLNGYNITNTTITIWDSSNNSFFSQTNITLGTINITSFQSTNLTEGDYKWNILTCAENATFSQCVYADSNFTFSWSPFLIDNEDFEAFVLETSKQDFLINITTIPSILSVNSILNYNGTRFTAVTSCSGPVCQIETALDIPLVLTGESQNNSFFWEITVFDGVTSFTSNTTINQQNVTKIHLEECDATFTQQTLNFSAFDEATLDTISPFSFAGDFNFWLGTGTVKRQNNISQSSVSSLQMCILPDDETYRLDGTIEYDEAAPNTNFTIRNYFFQNDTINNESENISLGLLESSESTSFILKVQNKDILPQPDVLIFTQRFYPGEGIFRTVQVSQTDDNGATIGFFKTETVDYRFILKQAGQTLLVTNKQKIVGEDVPFTLTFTIGEDDGAAWEDFEDLPELTSSLTFNKTTNIVTFTYLDTSGNFTSGRLVVEKVEASELTNTIICDQTSTQSSATITCNITGNQTGLYIARGVINRQGDTFLVDQIGFSLEDFSTISGNLGLFIGWFIILIGSFMFKFNEIAGIIMVNMTVIFVNLVGLISFGYVFISAMIALSIMILVVLER